MSFIVHLACCCTTDCLDNNHGLIVLLPSVIVWFDIKFDKTDVVSLICAAGVGAWYFFTKVWPSRSF